jgi:hypothetical protein
MTPPATPATTEEPTSHDLGAALLRAQWKGALAWIPLAIAGQVIAWFAYAVTGAFRPWSWVKVGLLHLLAVSRVGIEVRTAPGSGLRRVFPELIGSGSVRVSLALGAGTIVAIVLLFRAGRDAASGSGDRPFTAAMLGGAVAPSFAVLCGLAGLLVTLRFPQAAVTVLHPVVWQAFVFPFVLAAVCGTAGGLSHARPALGTTLMGRRTTAIVRGGWYALVWGVGLSFLGFLVLATVRPGATAAYGRWLEGRGGAGAVVAVEHALLLPNQSVQILAISMGACASLETGGETSRLCLGGLDAGEGVTLLLTGGRRELPFGPGYLLFLAVPAVATAAGGRRAAEGIAKPMERATRASWAGVAFGVLVGAAVWLAGVTLSSEGARVAHLGADPVEAGAIGVVWGVVGGALGSVLPDRRGVPPEAPLRRQPPEDSPSETSVK